MNYVTSRYVTYLGNIIDACLLLAAEVTGANRVGNYHISNNNTSPAHQRLSKWFDPIAVFIDISPWLNSRLIVIFP
jgi:hypothetical protein